MPDNPKCTEFCTQGGSRGHRATSQADIGYMRGLLTALGIGAGAPEFGVPVLYEQGYGYHNAADALGISHERAYLIITGQAG